MQQRYITTNLKIACVNYNAIFIFQIFIKNPIYYFHVKLCI